MSKEEVQKKNFENFELFTALSFDEDIDDEGLLLPPFGLDTPCKVLEWCNQRKI